MKTILIIAAFFMAWASAQSQSYFEDTVWTKKTDQASGFYQVKFSNNDSIIVGHGYENAIFYNAFDGEEIARLPFNAEVHFIDNDNKYLQLAPSRDRLIIYETETHFPIDTIENEGIAIGGVSISQDEQYIFGVISSGVRLWSLETGIILNTFMFQKEENEVLTEIYKPSILNDNSKAIITVYKEFNVNNQTEVRRYYPVFNLLTLDSIDTWEFFGKGATWYKLSKTNAYFAIKTGDKYEGVEIYDFNTKQLMHKLPVNGPSLTGIEFSPDDKYVVTSNGPGQNSLIVWDVMTGEEHYRYTETSFSNFDISNDGRHIIISVGRYLDLIRTKFNTSIPILEEKYSLIYPNPATGEVNINNVILNEVKDPEIKVYNVLGGKLIDELRWSVDTRLRGNDIIVSSDGNVRIDVSSISPGVYFVRIGNKVMKFIKI